nr:MAG TPA: hypothetical protein [Caudoviricetes sp.]DAM97939.1 MAG TPA: hypothetical protein [Caudoviricetes sp.]
MTRKRYIKLVMSLLYGKNQAVEQAWYINSLMKTDKRVTYQGAWNMLDEYDDHYHKVMTNKKNKEKL